MAHLSHHHAYSGQHVYSGGKSKKELFRKIVNRLQLLANFPKSFILDFWLGSEYTFEYLPICIAYIKWFDGE